MTSQEMEDAVEKGIIRAFARLGLVIETHSQAVDVQRDMAFLRDMRTGSQSLKSKGTWALMATVMTAICGFIWAGFQVVLRSGSQLP